MSVRTPRLHPWKREPWKPPPVDRTPPLDEWIDEETGFRIREYEHGFTIDTRPDKPPQPRAD